MNEVRGGEVAGLDGHGDEAAGRGGQAPHVHDVRAPDPAGEVLPALLARGTRTVHESGLLVLLLRASQVARGAFTDP